jgi:SAM-dependent methyltransferase
LPPAADILVAGCGPGNLWQHNRQKIPAGWRMILSDLSLGMVTEARQGLNDLPNVSYVALDISDAPLPPSSFDVVTANHMLYHVPDVGRALATIHDLLKPGGVLYATTIGRTHLRELATYINRAKDDPVLEADNVFQRSVKNFNLQNGRQQLLSLFAKVECHTYPDSLEVDDPEAIIHYVESSPAFDLSSDDLTNLKVLLQDDLDSNGTITISKESGIFIARKTVSA